MCRSFSFRIQCTVASLFALLLCSCGLPKGGERPTSTALTDNSRTSLAGIVRPRVAAHPGQSGLHPLADAREAIAARLTLADEAQQSIDIQYFIWNRDMVGKVLVERLLRAADRGVRVRLLLDDLGTMPSDAVLLALDSHPKIEVRMFNPAKLRSPRMIGVLVDLKRLNRRMHNKSFTVDGQVSVVGGRNIGDEYYAAHSVANFADLDLAVIGPAVRQVSDQFDLYWNHAASVPISNLARQHTTSEEFATKRAALLSHRGSTAQSAYANSVRESEFVRQLRRRSLSFFWGRTTIVADHPDKVMTSSSDTGTHLAPQLRELIARTKRELFLISPYFVPGKQGVALLADAHARGVRVVVFTNSLASTDGIAVQSKYRFYRKPLIEAGVELYEMKPTASGGRARASRGGFFGSGSAGGPSGASLHAKTFSFDRKIGFVGSYNIDPRSSRLNTEMGVLFDCPPLTKRLPEETERDLARNAYRMELVGNRVVWVSHEDGKEVRFDSEPEASLGKRLKARVLGWLPIEGLL